VPPRRTPSLVAAPQQQRSRATHDALLLAFRRLLRTKPFAEITVAEIAGAAEMSVGGFYARFAAKDALLVPLMDEILLEARQAVDATLDAPGVATSLARIIEAYVGAMIHAFREHRLTFQQIRQAASGETAVALMRSTHEFNVFAHDRFRTLALEHRASIRHRSPGQAIEMALFIGSAAAREAVLSENWKSYEIRPDDATLAAEISRAMRRYLEGGP
jgi:AcrR family transcriptional regulator